MVPILKEIVSIVQSDVLGAGAGRDLDSPGVRVLPTAKCGIAGWCNHCVNRWIKARGCKCS